MADVVTADLREREDASAARPYAPSGVDRLTDWVRRLPGPVAVFYLGVGASLVLLEWAIKWGDGTYQRVGIIPAALYHATLMLSGLYCLSAIHQLDDMAQATLARFRSLLTGDAATQALLAWRLTTLPARPALLAGIAGVLVALLMLWLTAPITHDQLHLFTSPAAMILEVVVWVGTWYFTSTFIYHTIRQARVINQIYTRHTRVDLFEPGQLYAFSWLTCRTAVRIMLALYVWSLVAPPIWEAPERAALGLGVGLVAVVAFTWPLLGVHQLLSAEKEREQGAVAQRMARAIAELRRRVDAGDLEGIERLQSAMESLVIAEKTLDKIPTWPWHPGAAREMGAALLLPVILWLITRLLERVITF